MCASSFLTYKRRPLHIKQFPIGIPPPPLITLVTNISSLEMFVTKDKTSRPNNDVIASGDHQVYDVLIIIFFISCMWVTQRGYPAELCKNSVPFCLFTLACLVIIVKNILVGRQGEWCSLRGRRNDTRTDFKWNKIVFLLRKHINQVGYIYSYRCVFDF